ncbi:ORF6N domain-containing protein [Desulfovibrio sp. OttesenSCG-928-A18]|nr:ORF6N domain-containing protein [Desulfovibrio sp. OttesenSCG-928-A18]
MNTPSIAPSPANPLPPITYRGHPVVTTELLAQAYGCSTRNIQDNFANNRERFVEGKHFYLLVNEELKTFRDLQHENFGSQIALSPKARSLTIWLERGAARHAKMLNTDQAWDVFEMLEETFFRVVKVGQPAAPGNNPRATGSSSAEITARSVATSYRMLARMKGVYPPEMLAIFAAKAVTSLTGEPLQPLLPPISDTHDTWLSPTQLAEHFGISANGIGRRLKSLGLHGADDLERKYSMAVWNKSRHSDKQVVSYLYDPAIVIPRLTETMSSESE